MNDITNDNKQPEQKKKHVKKNSLNGDTDHLFNGNLLGDDQPIIDQQLPSKAGKRGPKIDENVQVKICDMGNGCWTYHHFTPEI